MLTTLLVLTLTQFPKSQCVTTNGTGACGYDCKTTNGKAACASTPWGRCTTTDGKIFCADPAPVAVRFGASRPVECVTTNGTGACGYDCKTTNGKAACASTPWGRCTTTDGKIFCGDPGYAAFRSGEPSQMECVTTNGTGACGYGCKTSNGRAACSQVPWGSCTTTNGKIFCTEAVEAPPANCVNGTCQY